MQQFKVGDWVRNTNINRIFQYSYADLIYDKANPNHSKHDEFWQPKQGEWCWFRTCNCGFELGQFIEPLSNGYRYKLNSTNSLFNCNYCEPFIGELPSFLKEQQ